METHAVSLFLSEIHDFSPSSEDDLLPTVLLLDTLWPYILSYFWETFFFELFVVGNFFVFEIGRAHV